MWRRWKSTSRLYVVLPTSSPYHLSSSAATMSTTESQSTASRMSTTPYNASPCTTPTIAEWSQRRHTTSKGPREPWLPLPQSRSGNPLSHHQEKRNVVLMPHQAHRRIWHYGLQDDNLGILGILRFIGCYWHLKRKKRDIL